MRRQASRHPLSLVLGATAACLAAGLLAGCGSSSSSSSGGTASSATTSGTSSAAPAKVTADAPLAHAVPAAWRGKTLTVAVTVFPPYEILSGSRIIGLDPDLYQALGQELGVRVRIAQTTFDSIIPGLQSGRYQVASPMGDFVERQQVLDMADYAEGSSSLLVASSATFRPTNVMQLCGQPVGIEAGSAETGVTAVLNQRCHAAGKSAVSIRTFPDVSAATVAASSGQIRGVLSDAAANGYAAREAGGTFDNLLLSGGSGIPGWGATFAMGTPKGSGLAAALVAGLKQLAANGTYKKVFTQWGLTFEMIPASDFKVDGSTAHEAS
jgi:polar amino acid transport system substrate-binding protein